MTAPMAQDGRAMSETTDEWGIEFEGRFIPLDSDVPNDRATAESALGEALDYGADATSTFVAMRQVGPWRRYVPTTPAPAARACPDDPADVPGEVSE